LDNKNLYNWQKLYQHLRRSLNRYLIGINEAEHKKRFKVDCEVMWVDLDDVSRKRENKEWNGEASL
jgi:hypothetical protein